MGSSQVIGWIGAGRMGVPMAGFILKAGNPVLVYSRSAAGSDQLVAQGARAATTVAACAREADVVFSSIPDDNALRNIALGPDGVLAAIKPGGIFVDTSTVSPEVSEEVGREATQRGIAYLRAPISGNAISAQAGDVTVFVSGPEAAWNTVKPIIQTFSKTQIYLGDGERARYLKLVVNAIVLVTAQGLAEALTLGRKAGLPWDAMLDAIGQSTIASPWLKAKLALMKPRDFTPTMTTRLILKDLDLMLAAARSNDVPMPLIAMTRQMMQAVIGAGLGEEDYMAIIKLAELQSGLSTENTSV